MSHLSNDKICITLDLDWAPEKVIQDALEMLVRAGIKATIFATHASQFLDKLDRNQFDVGLHPNFQRSNGDYAGILSELKNLYPRALGARSHSLFVSSPILKSYIAQGLKYESNIFLPYHEGLHPVQRFKDLVSIPFYWSDDKHIEMQKPFSIDQLRLYVDGLKVLNFHPMHVFMNTMSQSHYEGFKRHYLDPEALESFVNKTEDGMGTLFSSLLRNLRETRVRTYTLREIYDQFVASIG